MASTIGIIGPNDLLSDSKPHSAGFVDEKGAFSDTTPRTTSFATHHAADADLGLKILRDRVDDEPYVLQPAMRKRVLRKIDLHILPILT